MADRGALLGAAVVPLLLGALAAGLCYAAAGASLGLLLGGLAFAALLTGALVLAEDTAIRRALSAAGLIDGIALVWLIGVVHAAFSISQWLACYLLLAAWVAAIAALAVWLSRLGAGRLAASALSVLAAGLWLTWPIWLSPWLNGRPGQTLTACLVAPHPLLAANAVVHNQLGIWTQQGLMYELTSLGQHVPYSLPDGVTAAVLAHLAIAAVLLLLIRWQGGRDRKRLV